MDDPNHEECGDESLSSSGVLSPHTLSMPSLATPRNSEDVWSDINDLSILDQTNPNKNALSMSDTVLLAFMPGSSPTSDSSTTTTFTPPPVTSLSRTRSTALTLITAGSGDRRAAATAKAAEEAKGIRLRKRKIKNRESAARSRARQHGYITELETEISRLRKDNARIKRNLLQREAEAAAEEHVAKKKRGLYRTFTGPF